MADADSDFEHPSAESDVFVIVPVPGPTSGPAPVPAPVPAPGPVPVPAVTVPAKLCKFYGCRSDAPYMIADKPCCLMHAVQAKMDEPQSFIAIRDMAGRFAFCSNAGCINRYKMYTYLSYIACSLSCRNDLEDSYSGYWCPVSCSVPACMATCESKFKKFEDGVAVLKACSDACLTILNADPNTKKRGGLFLRQWHESKSTSEPAPPTTTVSEPAPTTTTTPAPASATTPAPALTTTPASLQVPKKRDWICNNPLLMFYMGFLVAMLVCGAALVHHIERSIPHPMLVSRSPDIYYLGCYLTPFLSDQDYPNVSLDHDTVEQCKNWAIERRQPVFGVRRFATDASGTTHAPGCYVSDASLLTDLRVFDRCSLDASGTRLQGGKGTIALYRIALTS